MILAAMDGTEGRDEPPEVGATSRRIDRQPRRRDLARIWHQLARWLTARRRDRVTFRSPRNNASPSKGKPARRYCAYAALLNRDCKT
jgi:hypothetical protein